MNDSILRLVVSGRVQGVGYRFFCQRKAHELGVSGWARNCPDGTVEVVVSGAKEPLSEFVAALKQGPKFGRVKEVAVEPAPDNGVVEFESGSFHIR